MAQTYYTLEEAAEKLGISVSEMKRKMQSEWKHLRPFRDGPTLRFKVDEIDSLKSSAKPTDDLILDLDDAPPAKSSKPANDDLLLLDDSPAKSGKLPKKGSKVSEDDDFLLLDDTPSPNKSGKLVKGDSASRLSGSTKSSKSGSKPAPTEEVELELDMPSDPRPSKSGALPTPPKQAGGSTARLQSGNLNETGDFELDLADDALDLGAMPAKDATTRAGDSGIMRIPPRDSGISLEKKKPGGDEEIDFELSLDANASSPRHSSTGPKSSKKIMDSDSEFELSLDDDIMSAPAPANQGPKTSIIKKNTASSPPKGDIFETSFEIQSAGEESGSEVLDLEEETDLEASDSDFEIALDDSDSSAEDESGSQVAEIDEVTSSRSGRLQRGEEADIGADDLEDSASASAAMRRAAREEAEADEDEAPVVVAAGPAPWGIVPALLMFPCVIVGIVSALMCFELVHTMWGYQTASRPSSVVSLGIANMFGLEVPKD